MSNIKIVLGYLKMKKTMLICFIFLLSGFLLSSCNDVPSNPGISAQLNLKTSTLNTLNPDSSFAIYVFKDTSIRINELQENGFDFNSYIGRDVSSLNKELDLWLSVADIELYDYSSHTIYLKQDKSFLFYDDYRKVEGGKFFEENGLRPFLVVGCRKICYMGFFTNPVHYSHQGMVNLPVITHINIIRCGNNVLPVSNVEFHAKTELITALKYDNIFCIPYRPR